jgi:acyl-CoA thioesterase-1
LRLALLLAALVVAGLEFPHWRLPPIPAGQHRRMAVIGDSISAGVGFAGERTWHEVFAEETGIAVDALAVGGGTCASAFPDAARISPDAALVLLEIGGNDILGRTPLPRYAADLDRLLAAVAVPGRTVVMLEVPVPPLHAGFCAAQRRLAAKHGVVLLPRRVFSAFLQGREATVDGLHLSNLGHRRMGRRLAAILAPALARDVRTAP